jgi:hypothetical protein
VVVVDIGFRPNPDGYCFQNYGGINFNDYTIEDMRRMFGDEAVCRMVGSICIPRFSAWVWWRIAHIVGMQGGHCDGMASTSLRFFKGLDRPSDFQIGASTTYDLQRDNVRRHIAYYFVKQLTDPVRSYKEMIRQNTPSAILERLRSAMSNSAPDPTTLFMRLAGQGGHTITPYAIEDKGDGVYWVWVYDNNHPNDASRYVVITTTTESWSYNLGWTTWSGDARTKTLGIVPISKYAEQPVCPWCKRGGGSGDRAEVWLTGPGHLLITDSQGRRLGYFGNQLVSEIPGAYASIIDTGMGVELEPIYVLPLTEKYTILLDGQTLTQPGFADVTQFGPGYAISVDDVPVGTGTRDELSFTQSGTLLSYRVSQGKVITLTFALDELGESYQFQIKEADIGAGQIITAIVVTDTHQLVFSNAQAGGGVYNLDVQCVNATGQQRFFHAGIDISATDTHILDYACTSGPMLLHIDQGSNGTIDKTVVLENQAPRVYLPLVLRNYR